MSVFFPFIFIIFVASPAASFTEEWFSSDLKAFEIFSFNEVSVLSKTKFSEIFQILKCNTSLPEYEFEQSFQKMNACKL